MSPAFFAFRRWKSFSAYCAHLAGLSQLPFPYVVTAKTQYSLANAQSYFAEHLAVGDYYQEGQKVGGEWFGIAAESLGLCGKVGEAEFLVLCENTHPQTGDEIQAVFLGQLQRTAEMGVVFA